MVARRALRVALAAACLALTAAAVAQTCNNMTPDDAANARYQVNGDGTVTDLQTGLMWMRCSLGQTWDGSSTNCTGSASTYTWQDALQAAQNLDQSGGFAGYTDWRLPNLRELMSVVRYHCYDPAINLTMFPATAGAIYWSSSPLEGSYGLDWTINFDTGQAIYNAYTSTFAVRLVRAGAFFP